MPLMVAAENRQWDVVEVLKPETPAYTIHVAVLFNDLNTVKSMLDVYPILLEETYGVGGWGPTPFMMAVNSNHIEMAAMLYERGAPLDCSAADGWSLFHTLAENNLRDMIRWLRDLGCDINYRAPRTYNKSVLYTEATKNHADMMEYLISLGADVNLPDSNGLSPLHAAAAAGHEQAAEVLLRHGAEINATDKDGRSPLHLAAAAGRLNLVRRLVAAGADKKLRDKEGQTPADCAQAQGHTKAAAFLTGSAG